MRMLLDTHSFLWFITGSLGVNPQAKRAKPPQGGSIVSHARCVS
jgi:PIN domain nuclease of toxin-antitoxin system